MRSGQRTVGVFSASFALVAGMVVSVAAPAHVVSAVSKPDASKPAVAVAHVSPLRAPKSTGSGLVAIPAGTGPRGVAVVGEFPKLRTANSRTYLTKTGKRVATVFPGAVNYRSASKAWTPIDTTAVANSSGWSETGNSWQALLPKSLSSPVTVTSDGEHLSMALLGAHGAGQAAGSAVRYRGALRSTTVRYTLLNEAVQESTVLSSRAAPSSDQWLVNLTSGSRLVTAPGGALAVVDAKGATGLELAAPTVTDASGKAGPAPSMTAAASPQGWVVTVRVDRAWLASPKTSWPVTVDPTVYVQNAASPDCQISQASGYSYCGSEPLHVGYDGTYLTRMLLGFPDVHNDIPWNAQVTQGFVAALVSAEANSLPVNLDMYPVTTPWTTGATWTTSNGTTAWTTAGGDFNNATNNAALSVTGTGWYSFDDTSAVAQIVSGATANDGFIFNETPVTPTNTLAFDTWQDANSANWPVLLVGYTLPAGTAPSYNYVASHRLSDNSSIEVNPASGDVVYQATDSNVNGVGLNQTIVRTWDSQAAQTVGTGGGAGWLFDTGADTTITTESDDVVLRMFGNSRQVFDRVPQSLTAFVSPPGFDATLTEPTAGNYTLTFNADQEVWAFGDLNGYVSTLLSEKDRNGDTITFNYSCGSGCPMTSITDTEGRTTTVAHNTNGYVSSITDPISRATTYAHANSSDPTQLTGVTDADGHTTSYVYDSSENLTQITDGDGNITNLTYGPTPANHQVQSITYGATTSAAATWQFDYLPSSSVNGATTSVTDPDGHTSVYATDNNGKVVKVTDPLGHSRATSWNADNQPTTLTDAFTPSAATSLGYDSANNQLDSASLPASATGQTAASWTAAYNTTAASGGGTVTGGSFLPSSSTDAQGNCQNTQYDNNGNPTVVDSGLTGTNCAPGGTNTSTVSYQGDGSTTCTGAKPGEVCSTVDPNGQTTSDTYFSDGDLKTVTPPSPLGPTSYTYDGASQVATVNDGNANSGAPGLAYGVQSATTNMTSGHASTITVNLAVNVTAGDALVVSVGSDPAATVPVVSTVTGGGVTWAQGASGGNSTVGDTELWYGTNSTGGSGTTAITVTMNAATNDLGADVAEFTGVAATGALAAHGATSGTGTTASVPALTAAATGDEIFDAANTTTTPTASPTSAYDTAGPENSSGVYHNPTAETIGGPTYTASWTQSPSAAWATVGIALKPAPATTTYTYDSMGRVTQILYAGGTACVYGSGNCITYIYDNNGNLTEQIDNTGNTYWTYDALGRVTKKTLPSAADACSGQGGITFTYDPASNLTGLCDTSGTTTYKYDAANENTSVLEPGGTTGCVVAAAATHAPITPVQSATANLGATNTSSAVATLARNVTSGDALVLTVTGAAASPVATVSSVSGGGVTWTRGPAVSSTGVGDNEIWYGVNSSGGSGTTAVTVTMTASDEPVGASLQEFTGVATSSPVDTSGTNSGTGTTVSTPTSFTTGTAGDLVLDASGTTSPVTTGPASAWTDLPGPQLIDGYYQNPAAEQTGAPAAAYNTSWTQTTSGAWQTVGVALKPATRAAVTQNLTGGCTAFGYDNDGRRTTTQYPGGATETVAYLPSGLTAAIGATTSTGARITHYTYTYTTAGASTVDTSLVQSRVENDPSTSNTNVTVTYNYDTMNRLISAVASTGTSYYYSYDADGNRTCAQTTGTCTTTPYSYNSADELTTGPAGTYTYDADGNETSSPQLTSLAYTPKNQTAAATPSGGSTQNYTYSGADSTQRTTAGTTTFAPNGTDIYQSTTSGTPTYDIYDSSGDLLGIRTGGSSYYLAHDNIGSIVAVITNTGTISDRYTYDPYGKQTVTTAGVTNPWGYAGGYTDTLTGLTKFGTRYYDPTTARWTQLDPSHQDPGYVYAGDNSVNYADPSGLDCTQSECETPSVSEYDAATAGSVSAPPCTKQAVEGAVGGGGGVAVATTPIDLPGVVAGAIFGAIFGDAECVIG